jgi:hypothetical protein
VYHSIHKIRTLVVLVLCALAAFSGSAHASTTISSDGAVGVNASWEAGKSSTWYIELQRTGADYIQTGVQQENDALIQQGLLMCNWGFNKQAADGSFPGTGDAFHSVSLFVEDVAHATLLLQQYHPVTYTANYSSVVTSYTKKLHAAALWLTQPAIASAGQQFDKPYTHRRWLLAAALQQTATLSGDTTLAAAAVPYVNDGLSLQWSNGVNPELGGYDVEYQCAGILFAEHYWPLCNNTSLQSRILNMISLGLGWEMTRLDVKGNLNSTGSTRVGIELNRDGTVKTPTMSQICLTFAIGAQLTGNHAFQVASTRIDQGHDLPNSYPVAASGADSTNINWEQGQVTTWALGLQKAGADWVQAGIDREDDSLIREGLLILNWGFGKQGSDGSFPGTSSAFYNTALFTEAAARVALLLQQYHPVTYTADSTYYTGVVTSYTQKLHAAALWMMQPTVAAAGQKSDLPFTSHRWLTAAALAQMAKLTGDASIAAAAVPYATNGLTLQEANGINPEKGTFDVNYQAQGILYAERYYSLCTSATLQAQILKMIKLGLQWEMTRMDVEGDVNTGTSSGASYPSIKQAFALGYSLTDFQPFEVASARLNANH